MNDQLLPDPVQPRGGVILTLSVLSLILLGPLTGVPAWLMANQDIRDIRTGALLDPHGLVGIARVIAIIGTFCSPLWLIIYYVIIEMALTLFSALGAVIG